VCACAAARAFFPLVGTVVVGLVAALVALVSEGVLAAALVIAAIMVIQQLEGDLLYPVVVGRSIGCTRSRSCWR